MIPARRNLVTHPHTSPRRMSGHIHQLSRSPGGVPKRAVETVMLLTTGLEGDWQHNRKYHGGPDRALCLFPQELIEQLNAEGHPIVAGSVGENVTTRGIDWTLMVPGARLALGDTAVIEVLSYTAPCRTIRAAFADEDFTRISQKLHHGQSRVYARVLAEGMLQRDEPIRFH